MYDLITVGGGPAGLTAAIYARRAGKTVLILEKGTFGGQITWSPKVENYPGFSAISGLELGDRLTSQAMELGAETELDEVVSAEKTENGFLVTTAFSGSFQSSALILATGARPRRLGLPDEKKWIGHGISFCAVCDGEFYNGRTVAVNGGGNTALQEALYLSGICQKVYLIHRRNEFRGDAALQEAVSHRTNVEPVLGFRVTALRGDDRLTGAVVTDGDGNVRDILLDGLFVAIGHEPQNAAFAHLVRLSEDGYADCDESCTTHTPGMFVAGDCRKKGVYQVTTAMADGAVAAIAACRYVDEK